MFASLQVVLSAVMVLRNAESASLSVSSMHEVFMQQQMRSEMYVSGTAASKQTASFADDQWSKLLDQSQEAVELLRFITGYKSGLDTFVDVTTMTPMLQNAQGLELYGFIGTLVNNYSATTQAYINNETEQCSQTSHSEGNGWSLSVDLGFTPPKRKDKIHPRKIVPLLSNAMFADARFGRVAVHEAVYDGHTVNPQAGNTQFEKDVSTAQNATVFRCDGGAEEFLRNLQLAAEAQKLVLKKSDETQVFQAALKTVEVKPTTTSSMYVHPGQLAVTFNPKGVQLTPGLPVYFSDAVTDGWVRAEQVWMNVSAPFEPMGSVVSVKNDTAVLSFSTGCVPSAANSWEPRMQVPVSQAAIDSAKQFVSDAKDLAQQKHHQIKKASGHKGQHLDKAVNGEVIVGTLVLDEFVGHIDLKSKSLWETKDGQQKFHAQLSKPKRSEGAISHIGKVCVVTEQAHGRFVDKFFDLPKVEEGERVVAHFTATGHGWASTEEQCGEFCKMKYNISFDGDRPAEFMQWRDDCDNNPTGNSQYGTWWESRNGWCPGSVSAGVYFDITDSLKKDSTNHRLTIDLSVLNKDSGSYQPYTNLKGWLKHDESVLNTDMKVFIYPKAAVQAARQWHGKSCSKAHAALQTGSLQPLGGFWPRGEGPRKPEQEELPTQEESVKERRSLRDGIRDGMVSMDAETPPACSIDFEATAPWHLFHEDRWGREGEEMTWVSVFHKRLIQGNTQVQAVHLNRTSLPKTWGQVGLRLRLQRPDGPGLDFDHWDRIGSIGLVVDRPLPPPVPRQVQQKETYSMSWGFSMLIMTTVLVAMLVLTINTSREKWEAFVSKRDVTKPIKRSGKAQLESDKDIGYGTVSQ